MSTPPPDKVKVRLRNNGDLENAVAWLLLHGLYTVVQRGHVNNEYGQAVIAEVRKALVERGHLS